ncbi:PrpF protein-domain-containing protein [Apiospora arundinis]
MAVTPKRRTRRSIPAVLMRAGTSKGLFLHRAHLPPLEQDWAGPLLAAMGSRYNDTRQIDGVGGASSVTSKVAVVAPSQRPGVDVDYTFVQVVVGEDTVDLTGNCGNMCSGVGPFAIQEGLVLVPPETRMVDVRIFNTNTERIIVETVEVDEDGFVAEDGSYRIPGVKGPGSEIKVAFLDPAGSMTGKLFPTGKRSESIQVEGSKQVNGHMLAPFDVRVTLIDAANPFVVVDSETLPAVVRAQPRDSPLSLEVAESIRRLGAVRMGLAETVEAAALVRGTPKLAYVSRPASLSRANILENALRFDDAAAVPPPDIQILAYSMGRPHPSLQLTGGVCLASAVTMEGTVANRLSQKDSKPEPPSIDGLPPTPERTPSPSSLVDDARRALLGETQSIEVLPNMNGVMKRNIRLAHGSGVMEVETWTRLDGADEPAIDRCIVSRTARRLFEGNVLYYT